MEKAKANIDYNNTVIRLRGVAKSFEDYAVLRGIDLDLFQGENLVVLGRSGSGKSVLIKLISGLLKPDKGTIEVLGKDVTAISEKELQDLRIRIGFSFQNRTGFKGKRAVGNPGKGRRVAGRAKCR